ncbi:iron chelate uptake ABC transporter family permease subunit [Erwinia sp. E602]|uniref:FecCD family ABC transporter permease n=1 Tax=unclassified Erwinia TaxID=2622719 RepID=UPI0006F3FE08|nr:MULTISPECIES: iron ABC transporter permease [unclassified Erwinia]KQN53820.1 ABC transporter permease [Erwinia sp. Leaf53]PLV62300.1 ABC transporter permease [Erwinia sp. B116]QUG73802.1 iron chelate uptake ABC transporter family permease subunit [Erwinia sp. E602]
MTPILPARLRRAGFLCGLILLLLLALGSVFIGSRPIAPSVTWQALWQVDGRNSEHLLVHYLRLPRALLGLVVGIALGAAGTVMQALTRNPLADPGILGVNAGATLACVMAIAFLGLVDINQYIWFALGGAALTGAAVCALGGLRGNNPVRMVLAGAALSIVLLALTSLITVNSDEAIFDRFRHWAVGSLQGRGYDVLLPTTLLVALGIGLALLLAPALDTLALGVDLGKSLGVNPLRVWLLAALAIVLLSGAATAAAGPIGFIGLTAPHFARAFAGNDHRWLLPYAMLLSALLIVAADTLGRLVGYPGEISVGIMVALLGGPVFIGLVRRWKRVQP